MERSFFISLLCTGTLKYRKYVLYSELFTESSVCEVVFLNVFQYTIKLKSAMVFSSEVEVHGNRLFWSVIREGRQMVLARV